MNTTFDVIVIGGGSAGEVAAGRLSDAGMSVAVVENDLVGGQCSYWACMPAKAMSRPTQILAEARRVPAARDVVSGQVDPQEVFDFRDRMASFRKDDAQVDWLEKHGVTLLRGTGRLAGRRRVEIDGERVLTASTAVILATGSQPASLPIEGIEEADVFDNRDLMTTRDVPRRLLVIGGGTVGVETAQTMRRLGSEEVTIVEARDRLLPDEEPFASKELTAAFEEQGIDIVTGALVEAVEPTGEGTRARLGNGSSRTVDVLMNAAGREPGTDDLGLETVGLKPGEPIDVDVSLRSVAHPEWLYAVGDLNGNDLFTHMGKYEARIASDVILGHDGDVRRGRAGTPRIVFTDPAIAAVGHTEAVARAAGILVETRDASLAQVAEASLWGEETSGTAKIVVNADAGVLAGATFTGPSAVIEMAFAAQVAIVGRVPLTTFRHVVAQFPTFSEVWLDLTG